MELVKAAFPEISPEQTEQLEKLTTSFKNWNEKLNLVSRKDIENFEKHHLLHSLAILKFVTFPKGTRVIDIGTGGGLPGLPLAILNPGVDFFLCDSIRKKAVAIEAIIAETGIKNCVVVNKRAEKLESKWNYVLGRAVTNLPRFLSWIKDNIRDGDSEGLKHGVFYWKGSLYRSELEEASIEPFSIYPIEEKVPDPYFFEKYIIHLDTDSVLNGELPEVVIERRPGKSRKRMHKR